MVRDIYYHDRHIAANLENAIASYGRAGGVPAANLKRLRQWAATARLGMEPPTAEGSGE
jgi:hypothetical protein